MLAELIGRCAQLHAEERVDGGRRRCGARRPSRSAAGTMATAKRPESIDSVLPEVELLSDDADKQNGAEAAGRPERPAARATRLLRGRVDDSPQGLHGRRAGPRRPRRRSDRPARGRLRRGADLPPRQGALGGGRPGQRLRRGHLPPGRLHRNRGRSATPARPPPTSAAARSSSARNRASSSPSPTAAPTSAARSASSRPPATSSVPATAASTTSRASGSAARRCGRSTSSRPACARARSRSGRATASPRSSSRSAPATPASSPVESGNICIRPVRPPSRPLAIE